MFCFLSEQIDLIGGMEEEAAVRIAYCDCNENLWKPDVVKAALASLRRYGGDREDSEYAWKGLLQVRGVKSLYMKCVCRERGPQPRRWTL